MNHVQNAEQEMLGLKRLHGFLEVTAAQVHNGNYAKWFGINKWYQSFALRNFDLEDMELESKNSGPTAKLSILKLGEYEMWVIRIKQYFQIQDYALWEVIENEEKISKRNDVKARGLLLMALPNEHQLTLSQYPDAKSMFATIETRFGESLDSIFNRLQKIISRLAILGVIIAQEDLNLKFLSSLPPEWNTHVVVWMNKPEVKTMSIDDLYNNFKIVKQKVKKIIGTSSGGQNLTFMTALRSSSTNDASTACSQVSAASPSVNTASPQVFTVSVSDNTVYAFMVENPNVSNVLHQDLELIHEDDLEVIDLKWQLSLLSVRAKKWSVTTVISWDTLPECKAPRSKEGQFRNQDNTRKQGNNEDTLKAMLDIDSVGFDWSDMAEVQVQTNMALMAFSDSEVYTDKTCSKTCLKNYETLKKQYDDLLDKLHETEFKAATYKRCLATIEDQLVTFRKNEFEKVKQEKDGIHFKIKKFDKASKDLDQLPNKLDLSYSGLDEFKEPEFKGYGPENSKQASNVVCENESNNSKQNSNKSLVKEQVSQDKSSFVEGYGSNTSKSVSEVEPKKVRKNDGAPIIEDWVSDDEEQDESKPKSEKKTVIPTAAKIEFAKPENHEKPVKKQVRKIQVCDGLGSHKKMIWRILPNRGGKMLKLMKITLVQMDAQTQGRHEHNQEFDAEITTVGVEVDDIAAET
ncbi:hypothetical protein Tco_0019491 [Tanacetum coccineum]